MSPQSCAGGALALERLAARGARSLAAHAAVVQRQQHLGLGRTKVLRLLRGRLQPRKKPRMAGRHSAGSGRVEPPRGARRAPWRAPSGTPFHRVRRAVSGVQVALTRVHALMLDCAF